MSLVSTTTIGRNSNARPLFPHWVGVLVQGDTLGLVAAAGGCHGVGGFVRQYSITVDPVRLREFDIPISRVSEVIATSNRDVGGRVIEMTETEYMVRGRGYLRGIEEALA